MSIYDVRSVKRRYVLLFLMACANCLLPISDTIYLPALVSIERDLNTTATMTAASVSLYLVMVGLAALLWGPVADRFGRRLTLFVSSLLFLGTTLVCVFASSIEVLVAFRALQGAAISAYSVGTSAVMADVFPPEQRGRSMGLLSIPILVGPVIGPLMGGGLSYSLGWRSTFVAMAVMGGAIFVGLIIFLEETSHPHVARQLSKSHSKLNLRQPSFREPIVRPRFELPWKPLGHLFEPAIFPSALATIVMFATMFSSLIVLPPVLAAPPYRLNEAQIGAANVAGGVGSFLAAPVGGFMADLAGRRWSGHPTGRMLFGQSAALLLFPTGMLMFAWGLHFQLHLALPLIGCFILGAGLASLMPATWALVTLVKQQNAAAAGGALHTCLFVLSGVFVQVTPLGTASLGVGPYVTMLTAFAASALAYALGNTLLQLRRVAAAPADADADTSAGACFDAPAAGEAGAAGKV
ncbi:MAG: major facilitator superfamily domain-containing protein [Monoraphidium minutum]|nr:MAG: major facilitator superfamily domain-containing protein [Monoraphidium minutum]